MRFILFIFLLITNATFSQSPAEIQIVLDKMIKESNVDKDDKTVFNLLNNFYEESLQSDSGITSEATKIKMDNFLKNSASKNKHIMTMFLAYQDYIGHCAATGRQPDSKLQVYLIGKTEEEILKLNENLPAVVFIYKAEALNSDGQLEECEKTVKSALQVYPNSVPLKVYHFLNTKDPNLKADLVKNHSNHWMVQQFGIR